MIITFRCQDDLAREQTKKLAKWTEEWLEDYNENLSVQEDHRAMISMSQRQLNGRVAALLQSVDQLIRTTAKQTELLQIHEESFAKLTNKTPGSTPTDPLFRDQFANQLNNNDKELARLNSEVRNLTGELKRVKDNVALDYASVSLGQVSAGGKVLQDNIRCQGSTLLEHRVDIDRLTKNLAEVREAIATAAMGGLHTISGAEATVARLEQMQKLWEDQARHINQLQGRLDCLGVHEDDNGLARVLALEKKVRRLERKLAQPRQKVKKAK